MSEAGHRMPDPPAPPHAFAVNGAELLADLSGALFWPARDTLVVADLHLEKGSNFAARGVPLPPYDSLATLDRLAGALRRYPASRVICLGDSFHDGGAGERLGPAGVDALSALTRDRDWLWIVGNHDPEPPTGWGGRVADSLTDGPLVFRHEAEPARVVAGEVSGHFHPKAAVHTGSGKRLSSRCFVTDGRRLILPAFGAFAGGLNARDPAVAGLFPRGFRALVLGRREVFVFPDRRLSPDPPRHRMAAR